jgi:hypothetical protein
MATFIMSFLTHLVVAVLSWSLVFTPVALAQQEPEPELSPEPILVSPQPPGPNAGPPAFTQQELDQMLAPIALYPDQLLSHMLTAATYPLEVIEAARWSKANPDLKGDQAVQAVSSFAWDPSVQALVAFPQVLATMDDQLSWMERLGDAFLSQQPQVMDTVQALRRKASDAGHLTSDEHLRVTQQGQAITIEPANPQVLYVPYYDPMVMYGSWWWPGYPPFYWGPWPGYYFGSGIGFGWGLGIGIGFGWWGGGFYWPSHRILLPNDRPWAHDPFHRRGVPYRDFALHQQFGRMSASAGARGEFRGFTSPPFGSHGFTSGRPDARGGAFGSVGGGGQGPHDLSGHAGTPPHAFEGVGHGSAERNFSARGSSSGGFGGGGGFGGRSFGGFGGGRGGGGGHHR